MTMDGSIMADSIITSLTAAGADTASIDKKFITALCAGIISHIQTNAVVNSGIPVSVTVTTPSGPGAGSGATTTPGTIS